MAKKKAPKQKAVRAPAPTSSRMVPSARKATPPATTPPKKRKPAEGEEKDPALMSPQEKIAHVMESVNTAFGVDVIRRANESETSHTLRRPTGICDLDIHGLAGGFPASSLCVITGPDGVGKDYVLNCTIRECQTNYGDEARIAIFGTEFPYDKVFAREQAGVRVAFTPGEIEDLNANRIKAGADPLTDEEAWEYGQQTGEIILIQGVLADHGFDVVLNLLETGAFQIIIINSLGVLETVAKDDTDSLEEHAIQSSEAQLLSRFIPKMFQYLNRPLGNGLRNQTTILAANQVRANRSMPRMKPGMPMPDYMKYQPGSGSRALAHGKAIDLMLHKGKHVLDESVKPPVPVGRTIDWEILKGKLGTHDGIEGSYDYFYAEGADLAASLLSQAVIHEVVEKAGSWYAYNDGEMSFRVQGEVNAATALRDQTLYRRIYLRTVAAAGVFCRYT